MPLSAAWCRRPRRFSHRFQRRFYRPIRDILRGHGRRQRGLVPLPKRTDAEEASHDHPEDGPGPTDSDVPVPLSPAKSQYRPPDPARAPVFPPFSPSDSLHFHCPLRPMRSTALEHARYWDTESISSISCRSAFRLFSRTAGASGCHLVPRRVNSGRLVAPEPPAGQRQSITASEGRQLSVIHSPTTFASRNTQSSHRRRC